MPQGEDFWNPYRLVPVRETVKRCAPWTDERYRGHSGLIRCEIENLTPLFVGAQASRTNHPPLLRENRYRIIPGSSLKGMLRSLAEIVGGGCFVVSDSTSPVPPGMEACKRINQLCIACRMFGAMERGQNARVHKGKVAIGDAIIREQIPKTKPLEVLLANNGVRHEPFYRSPHTGILDGKSRKLYFHQPQRKESTPPIPENIRDRAWIVDAVLPGHHFDFEVQFTSLTDEELSLLLYVLNLEEHVEVVVGEKKLRLAGPMRHKIGNAKPLGMGSCCIRLSRLEFLASPEERFSTLNVATSRILESEDLKSEVNRRIQPLVADQSPTMVALRKMMVWDESDSRHFRYPTYHEFKSPNMLETALKRI